MNLLNKIFLFSAFLLSNVVLAQPSVSSKIKKLNLYAGIEVGSKGVKMSILQMGKNARTTSAFNYIKDTSANTDFISFNSTTTSATLKALQSFYSIAFTDYNIPAHKIYTVFSSGVKVQADKEGKQNNLKQLADSFKLYTKDDNRIMPIIDPLEEAKLSHIGIVPEDRRYNTFLIDIGSGNTKGGYFKNGNTKELKLFALTWGTKSIANATEKRLGEDKSVANYKKQLARVIVGEPEAEIIYAVNESGAYNMNDFFAFSGGIAWSLATLMYPELYDNAVVPLSYNDALVFNDKLSNNFAALQPQTLLNTLSIDGVDTAMIIAECKKVHKVFDQKSLMAGTALLLKIMRQFEGTKEKKQFYLVKNGQVGWISAYVSQASSTD